MENNFASKAEVTRPANTTAYTAGDVVGATAAAIEFTNVGSGGGVGSGGHFIITDADLRFDLTSVPAGMTTFRLHLYDATPGSAYADNAAWDLPSGDRANYLGYIDLGTPVDVGSTLFVQVGDLKKKIWIKNSAALFGYLVTNGGYTPASAGTHAVRVNAIGI